MKLSILVILTALLIACNNNPPKLEPKVAAATTNTPSEPMPDSVTMMKNWEDYMTPGKEHKMMAEWNGKWEGDISMWMSPDAPPTQSTGIAENKMIMGGRYQVSTHKGHFNNMPFEGLSTLAFDDIKQVFISTWIDNFGTGVMNMEGTLDEATKTINFTGKMIDPMMGKEVDVRETFTIIDKDHQLMQMYCKGADGKEFKSMQIHFRRKK